ncbi:MAG: hypothetical protein CVU63_16630 [Deltaproteobacteria bacterium HGW-Deltaproteobacteria-20]|nr:MAG: hypothetical protein CVU63_16630 [Deltaproteobacteria bacterium HGW-Deltaproteobacteria-20]
MFFDRLFEEMGWENVVLLVANSENSYREMGATFNQDVWRALVLGDYFTDVRTSLRLLAKDPVDSMVVFSSVWRDVMKSLLGGPKELDRELKRAAERLDRIPRKARLEDVPKVLIVGEIYVRRDNFSVDEISEMLISKGIYPKVTGVTEWFHYTDFARKFILEGRRKRQGWLRSVRDGVVKEEAVYLVEKIWKEHVEGKVSKVLEPTGLIPHVPHDMGKIIGQGSKQFVDPEMESEATVSPAVGAAAMEEGYSGVAIIAPFGCLPGRLIEGVYAPWAKAREYPVLALENDGQPYPPNIVSRIEVFAHNVLRFKATDHVRKGATWRELAERVALGLFNGN